MSLYPRSLLLATLFCLSFVPASGMETLLAWTRPAVQKITHFMHPDSMVAQWALGRMASNMGATPLLRGARYADMVDKAWHDTPSLAAQQQRVFARFAVLAHTSKKKKSHAVTKKTKKKSASKSKKKKIIRPGGALVMPGAHGGALAMRYGLRVPTSTLMKMSRKEQKELVAKTVNALVVMHKKKLLTESVFTKAKRVFAALAQSVLIDRVDDAISMPLERRAYSSVDRAFGGHQNWTAAYAQGGGALIKKLAQGCALEIVGTVVGSTTGIAAHMSVTTLVGLAKKALGW